MKNSFAFIVALLLCNTAIAQEKVTIQGRVTDYNGNPLDSVSIFWHHANFSNAFETLTDKNGFYKASILRGKYQSMGGLNMSTYLHSSDLNRSEEDQRLEFWGWNFIADRDTTLNFQYHRMEAYGLNVFRIQGATPSYVIYVRPMSLTRAQQWMKNKTPEILLAPSPENLDVEVTIDGEPVKLLFKQEVKEYFDPTEWGNAYLLTVSLPKNKHNRPYLVVKVKLTDKENGDTGEAIYHLEKKEYL